MNQPKHQILLQALQELPNERGSVQSIMEKIQARHQIDLSNTSSQVYKNFLGVLSKKFDKVKGHYRLYDNEEVQLLKSKLTQADRCISIKDRVFFILS